MWFLAKIYRRFLKVSASTAPTIAIVDTAKYVSTGASAIGSCSAGGSDVTGHAPVEQHCLVHIPIREICRVPKADN